MDTKRTAIAWFIIAGVVMTTLLVAANPVVSPSPPAGKATTMPVILESNQGITDQSPTKPDHSAAPSQPSLSAAPAPPSGQKSRAPPVERKKQRAPAVNVTRVAGQSRGKGRGRKLGKGVATEKGVKDEKGVDVKEEVIVSPESGSYVQLQQLNEPFSELTKDDANLRDLLIGLVDIDGLQNEGQQQMTTEEAKVFREADELGHDFLQRQEVTEQRELQEDDILPVPRAKAFENPYNISYDTLEHPYSHFGSPFNYREYEHREIQRMMQEIQLLISHAVGRDEGQLYGRPERTEHKNGEQVEGASFGVTTSSSTSLSSVENIPKPRHQSKGRQTKCQIDRQKGRAGKEGAAGKGGRRGRGRARGVGGARGRGKQEMEPEIDAKELKSMESQTSQNKTKEGKLYRQ